MSNGQISRTQRSSDAMPCAAQDPLRFVAAQVEWCVGALQRSRSPSPPFAVDLEGSRPLAADERILPHAGERQDGNRDTLAHVAAAVGGVIYSYAPQTGSVKRAGDLRGLLGYAADVAQLSHASWQSLIHPDDVVRVQSLYQHAVTTGAPRATVEYRIRHAGGHYVHVRDRAALVRDGSGAVVRVIGCIDDVTALHRAEEILRDTERSRDEFLAVLAHELRNPLMPIRCALEVIGNATSGEHSIKKAHAIIKRQFAQMVRLLDDMLDVSTMARGKMVLRKERIDLHEILKSAVEAVRPLIDQKQHELELLLPLAPLHLHADGARLTQIICNLLTNAVKYTPAGGRIRLAARGIHERGEVEVRVLDTGIGIPAAELGRIFEMFARVEGEHAEPCSGLGIGLALSRELAVRHGGSITVHSDGPGHGAEFVLMLPVDATAIERHGTRAAPESPAYSSITRFLRHTSSSAMNLPPAETFSFDSTSRKSDSRRDLTIV